MQIELLKFPYSYMEYEKILQIRELKVLLPEIEVLSDDKHTVLLETTLGPPFCIKQQAYLLLLRQMCIFSASAMSCSRKSGCATEISASARSQVDRPLRLTMPYSVTI